MTEPTPKLSNIEIRNLISMRVFRYTCLICAILLTFRCINLFVRNKDVAEIKFFEYHEDEDNIYPSITFCHRHPFIEKALKKYDQDLSISRLVHTSNSMHYLKFSHEGTLIASYNEKKSNIVLRTAFAGEKYPVKMGDSWTFQKNPPYFGSS